MHAVQTGQDCAVSNLSLVLRQLYIVPRVISRSKIALLPHSQRSRSSTPVIACHHHRLATAEVESVDAALT